MDNPDNISKAIADATHAGFLNDTERQADMLDTIEAMHGLKARQAMEATVKLQISIRPLLRGLQVLGAPKDLVKALNDQIGYRGGMLNVTLFHMALGVPVPVDFVNGSDFDPRAEAMNKTLQAMLENHRREIDAATEKVGEILQQRGQ